MIEPTITVGQPFRARLVFRDRDGELIDPDPVIVKVLRPNGLQLSYTYGEDDEVVRDSEGVYAMWVRTVGGPAGDWTVAGQGGEGDEAIFDEAVIYVALSRFDVTVEESAGDSGITITASGLYAVLTLPGGAIINVGPGVIP